jgi:hypothetical protein
MAPCILNLDTRRKWSTSRPGRLVNRTPERSGRCEGKNI